MYVDFTTSRQRQDNNKSNMCRVYISREVGVDTPFRM